MSGEPSVPPWKDSDLARLRQLPWLRAVDYHDQLGSTNDRGLQLADDTTFEVPALVLANRQTAGRGRGTHRWWSPPGAVTASLVLEAANLRGPGQPPVVSLAAGVAICAALQHLVPGLEVGLKWPNDVCVRERKIGGILVEVPRLTTARLVIGFGLNINNSARHAPPPLNLSAIALRDCAQFPFNLSLVLQQVLQQLHDHLRALTEDRDELLDRWRSLCILTGRRVRIEIGARRLSGVCQGIDDQGALIVLTDQGAEHCLSGSVREISKHEA